MTFVFNIDDRLTRLIKHTIENYPHHQKPYTGEGWGTPEEGIEKPSLMLVKDRGVYVMSPFAKKDAPRECRLYSDGKEEGMFVCYATGHEPGTYLGGDDYCELVPIPKDYALFQRIMVNVTETSITIELMSPRTPPPGEPPKRRKKGR